MPKFNGVVTDRRKFARGPVEVTSSVPTTHTHEGAPAFERTAKGDLFICGVTNMVGEDTFYERASDRDLRFAELVREVATFDPQWLVGFVGWLRRTANMRSAPVVAAAEAVHARLASGLHGHNRALVDAAMLRADEPAEFVAYWRSRFGRTSLPSGVKRGLSDAMNRLWDEYATLKYDTPTDGGYRFGDLVDLVHPAPADPVKAELFEHLIARARGRDELFRGEGLPMLRARAELGRVPADQRRAMLGDWETFRAAGMTWEAVPAWLDAGGNGAMDAKAWEAIIPHMGLMALARNLRNFDQAGVSDQVAAKVAARFADPAQVAKSRMFPYRWLSAYEAAPSLRWSYGLEQALNASVSNIPVLDGETEILVDTSDSMNRKQYSSKSKMAPVRNAAIFGAALALRNPQARLLGFATGVFEHDVPRGGSVLKVVEAFCRRTGEVGHGTAIIESVRRSLRPGTRRVFVISDMQTQDGYGRGLGDVVPANVALYGVNLGGYRPTVVPAGDALRFEFPALGDAAFSMVPLLERGADSSWPWLG